MKQYIEESRRIGAFPIKTDAPMSLKQLKNHTCESLRTLFKDWGHPAFRGTQVFQWIWRSRVGKFSDMANLPPKLRKELEDKAEISELELVECNLASDGTRKLLVGLPDGERVESVLIPDNDRRTLCVSTQVGCAMACRFCRTATMGLKRHLEAWEIVDQILLAEKILTATGDGREISGGRSQRSKVARRLTNLVFMGMGEPLHNIHGTITALKILTSPEGLDISPRRITVSTVGLIHEAQQLLDETQVRLAFSLNAPDDERRSQIMPVNDRFSIAEIIEFVKELPLKRRDRVTFEYVVLAGLNDRDGDDLKLVKWLKPIGERVKINLIPFNPFEDSEFKRPTLKRVEEFREALLRSGIKAFIRRPRGDDILAACGQLALSRQQTKP
jgi:23S rRNA (adenine2503-C2)-methyltransferase